MKLADLSTSDLLKWYLFFDSMLLKLEFLHEDIPEENHSEILESKAGIDDKALKMVLIAKVLEKRSMNIDYGIDYDALGNIEIQEF